MYALSCILSIAGVAGLAVGIWMKVSPASLPPSIQEYVQPEVFLSYLLIGAGAVMVFQGLLGCFAAYKDSKCLRVLFFATALLALMALGGVVGFFESFGWVFHAMDCGTSTVEVIKQNKIFINWIAALQGLSMAFSIALYCTSKGRTTGPALPT